MVCAYRGRLARTALEVIDWLQSWGDWFYPIAFAWSFFEGETFVIFGGIAAHMGILNIKLLIATVWVGSFCGDQVWFFIGRRWGNQALARFPSAQSRAAVVLAWLERYGVWFILSFRFLYGVRNVASIALGTSQLPWSKFLFWNFIAAGIWAVSFAGAGYLLGEAAAAVGAYGPKVLLGILLAVIVTVFGWRAVVRKRGAKAVAPENNGAPPENAPENGEDKAKG
jgi:membrane protein DedA with SNARE-associated domain